VDGLEVHDINVFWRYAGMLFTDSPDATQNPRCGYGAGSDIDLDIMQVAIMVTASGAQGYQFTNLTTSAASGAQAAVQLNAGGSVAPNVLINGGSVVGTWASGPFPTPAAGNLTAVNVIGFNLP
jgi:hypothetical protein